MRKIFFSALLAAGLVLGVAGSGSATLDQWTAVVDSGGAGKLYDKQRVAKIWPWVAMSNAPAGGVKIVGYNCAGPGYGYVGKLNTILQGKSAAMEVAPNTCFRLYMYRAVAADTNGILIGKGTTDLAGRVEY